MLAAETVDRKNQMRWHNIQAEFLHWETLDASWNWQSSAGRIDPFSTEAHGMQARFQIDLNGNGLIG